MKIARILSLALCLLMIFSLVACGAPTNDDNKDKEPTTVAEYVERVNVAMKNAKVKITSKNTKTTNGIDVATTSITYADGENYITEVEGATNTFVDDTLYVSMPIVNKEIIIYLTGCRSCTWPCSLWKYRQRRRCRHICQS